MRPLVYSTAIVVLLIFAVAVVTSFVYYRPFTALGLSVFTGIAFHPVFLILYAAGFALTYWLTTRTA